MKIGDLIKLTKNYNVFEKNSIFLVIKVELPYITVFGVKGLFVILKNDYFYKNSIIE